MADIYDVYRIQRVKTREGIISEVIQTARTHGFERAKTIARENGNDFHQETFVTDKGEDTPLYCHKTRSMEVAS